MPSQEPQERVLLVEGNDECNVIGHMLHSLSRRGHDPIPDFNIKVSNGIDPLLGSIEGRVNEPDRRAIGILVDANSDPKSRWQEVTRRLRKVRVEPPDDPDPSGTVVEGAPRIGVWMMPDNVSPGELEDFIATMIPDGDAIWPLSQAYIEGIPSASRLFKPPKTLRAQVHAWLAAREDPRPMGLAIGAGDLDVNADVSRRFTDWLRNLFGA